VSHYLDRFGRREPFEMEYRLRRHDGVYRWILDRGVPFVDDAGNFAGFIGSCVDVDERRSPL
jgi:PAS domain S-box-containing protein